jgi:hypothetical protein
VRRNDEVEAQRRRWTFYEAIKALCNFCLTLSKKNAQEPFVNLFLDAGDQAVIFRKQLPSLRREAGSASPRPSRHLQNQGKTKLFFHEPGLPPGFAVGNSQASRGLGNGTGILNGLEERPPSFSKNRAAGRLQPDFGTNLNSMFHRSLLFDDLVKSRRNDGFVKSFRCQARKN